MKTILLNDIRTILAYHLENGISGYPASNTLDDFLHLPPIAARRSATIESKQCIAAEPSERKKITGNVSEKGSLEGLWAEISVCRRCDLMTNQVTATCGRGGKNPRLLVVGDWGHGESAPGGFSGQTVFGLEEDAMLGRMFKAIHLDEDDVYITNVVKCALGATGQPKVEQVGACMDYLHRQIRILMPKVICAMGAVPAKMLCDLKAPLSRLRGRFYRYVIDEQRAIPLIVTYHPSYLLANPEMKKATWVDLQLLEKQLQQ